MSTPSLPPSVAETEKYRSRVTRYIGSMLRDAAEAEDLTQETLLRVFQQQDKLRDPAALEAWIYRIATRVSLDRLRQRQRTVQRQIDVPAEDLLLIDNTKPSPFTVIQQAEMSECVDRYVADLPDHYKAVLLLHDADSLTAEEISQLLHLPLATVKMRLHRARKRLKALLNEACGFKHDDRGVFICEPKLSKRS